MDTLSISQICHQCARRLIPRHGNNHWLPWKHLFICLSLSVILLSKPVSSQPAFVTRPEDTDVRLGDATVFSCSFSNRGSNSVLWQKYIEGRNVILFQNNIRWTADRQYENITIEGEFNLRFSNAQKNDDANYECYLQGDSDGSLRQLVALTVLVPPGQPSISLNESESNLQEGDYVNFTCQSDGGNPTPEMSWYHNNVLQSAGITTPPSVKFGVTTSQYVRQLQKEDNDAEIKCGARVHKLKDDSEWEKNATKTLNVKYAPRVTMNTVSPYKRIENTMATFSCSANGNPPATFQWMKGSEIKSSESTYTIDSVAVSDAGTYRCNANNEVGSQSGTVVLEVQYPPKVSTNPSSSTTANEGSEVEVFCIVDAKPDYQRVRWLKGESMVSEERSLRFSQVLRTNAGNYKCVADNVLTPSGDPVQQRSGEAEVEIIVHYVPGQAVIAPPAPIQIGETVTLACSLPDPGMPAATSVEWTKEGSATVLGYKFNLTIENAQLSDNGYYICKPRNSVGPGTEARQMVNVYETPQFVSGGTLMGSRTVNISDSMTPVSCRVRGRPAPEFNWYKNGVKIENPNLHFTMTQSNTSVDTWSLEVTATLQWKGIGRQPADTSLSKQDAGSYVCNATNVVNVRGVSSSMQLIVQYPPSVNPKTGRVAVDLNQVAVLTCQAQAVPKPTFEWRKAGNKLTNSSRITITTQDTTDPAYPYSSVLRITNTEQTDFGDYTCHGLNLLGQSEVRISLTPKSVPDPPTNLAILESTWESVELEWQAGFDGGHTQWFKVWYTSRTYGTDTVRVPDGLTRFNVTNLNPKTSYTFSVYGKNVIGASSLSNNVSHTTSEFEINSPSTVQYDPEKRILTYTLPSNKHCGRVETNSDGQTWEVYERCDTTGSVTINSPGEVHGARVAICLVRRNDICSNFTHANIIKPPSNDVPVSTIIIVACVCGTIVLILLAILIYLCIRRRNQAKNYSSPSNKPTQPVPPRSNGVVNHGMESGDNIELDDPRNAGVFSVGGPYGYDHKHNGGGVIYDYHRQHSNGDMPDEHPPPYNGHSLERYNNKKNRDLDHQDSYHGSHRSTPRLPDKLYLDDPDGPHNHSQGSGSIHKDIPESGYSTPDPTRPKKVIYEVIV